MNIDEFIENRFPIQSLIANGSEYVKDAEWYYKNAKADAIFSYNAIKNKISKNKKILEVGGGIHLLTSYLKELNFYITSIEPGSFGPHIDRIRNKILSSIDNKNIFTNTLEEFHEKKEKFDFIFSINVLEHTLDIRTHLEKCIEMLKDDKSLLYIMCPNYSFPFEGHFYKFFIPFAPNITFKYLRKKELINKLGEEKYLNILNQLNFNCNYFNIKSLNLPIKFDNPLKEIFLRIEKDSDFKKRLFSNKIIKYTHFFLDKLRIKNLICKIYPVSFVPYLVMSIKKKVY